MSNSPRPAPPPPSPVLAVTSAIPNDGKSLTTSNLAIVMASSGARVLLVDANMRRPMLHRLSRCSGGALWFRW